MDLTNSSKSPSSDSPFAKLAPKSLCGKSGRKPGGQPGHSGSTLALVDDPNERTRRELGPCTGCGASLADAPEVGMERPQVFDLPPITVRVTGASIDRAPLRLWGHHPRSGAGRCDGVGAVRAADHRDHPLYLYAGQILSKKRTAQALAELFGTPVSEGTVAAMTRQAAPLLHRLGEEKRDLSLPMPWPYSGGEGRSTSLCGSSPARS